MTLNLRPSRLKKGSAMHDATFPTQEQLGELLERLLPANEDMDEKSASIILERQVVNRAWLANALKSRLELRIERMRARDEEIAPGLLQLVSKL